MSNDKDLEAFKKYIHEDITLHAVEKKHDGSIYINLDGESVELFITPEGMLDVHVDNRIREDILD